MAYLSCPTGHYAAASTDHLRQPARSRVHQMKDCNEASYDRQLIIALRSEYGGIGVEAQAQALHDKRRVPPVPSEVVAVDPHPSSFDALHRALAGHASVPLPLSARSRLYLVGHGNAAKRLVSGWTAPDLAAALANAGLREVAMVSIVADGAGCDPDRDNDDKGGDNAQVTAGASSFASVLHQRLRDLHAVTTTVHARVGVVRVAEVADAGVAGSIERGRKLTSKRPGEVATEHHEPRSKLTFSWNGRHQHVEWSR